MAQFAHQRTDKDFADLPRVREIVASDRTRLPFIIEFCGMPKAGKTTVLGRTARTLSRLGLRCVVVPEAATTKIDLSVRSDLFAFNALTCLENISQVIQQSQRRRDVDAVLLDRGPADSLVWFEFLKRLGLLSDRYSRVLESFVTMPPWFDQVHLIAYLDNDWRTYVRRYALDSPVTDEPKMTERHFGVLSDSYKQVFAAQFVATQIHPTESRLFTLEGSSSIEPEVTGELLAQRSSYEIWNWAQLNSVSLTERILRGIIQNQNQLLATLSASLVANTVVESLRDEQMTAFVNEVFARRPVDRSLHRAASELGTSMVRFVQRDEAESNADLLQLVAAAFIRNNGSYLVFRRASSEARSQLRGKLSLLVSGHVEAIDQALREGGKNEVENCLFRELREEIGHLDLPEVRSRFAIRVGDGEMGRRHLALVYEVSTYSKRVTIIDIPGAGDFERNPEFWTLDQIRARRGEFDDWSRELIDRL